MVKFSSKLSEEAITQLRDIAKETRRPLAWVLDEAVRQYVERARLRPAAMEATDAALDEHETLLGQLGDG